MYTGQPSLQRNYLNPAAWNKVNQSLLFFFKQRILMLLIQVLTAPFNNMRTLKFKIQSTVTLFTAVNHWSGPRRKQNVWLNRVKRSCSRAVIGGFRSTLSVSVFFWSVACRCNYD